MGVTAVLGEVGRPSTHVADGAERIDIQALFPLTFAGWRVDNTLPVILPSPDVQRTLDKIYNQVLSRTYVSPDGRRIMLSVAYGGDKGGGMSVHRPEICYPAQGFRILGSRVDQLHLIDRDIVVRRLDTRLSNRREPVTYWVVVGDRVVATGLDQKLVEIRYGLNDLIPDGFLVRVSSIESDPVVAWRGQDQFLGDLLTAMTPKARLRILGQSVAIL